MSYVPASSLKLDSSSFLLCCELSETYIEHSYLFLVPYKVSDLIAKARTLNLNLSLSIICYDKGSMNSSTRAYWALKAAGYQQVRVLYGGLKACVNTSIRLVLGPPAELQFTSIIKEFNSSVVTTKAEFSDLELKQDHVIYSGSNAVLLYDYSSDCEREKMIGYLEKLDLAVNPHKRNVVYGDLAGLVGMVLEFIGIKQILVVLDDFDGCVYGGSLYNTPHPSTVYESLGEIESGKRTSMMIESEHSLKEVQDHYSKHTSTKSLRSVESVDTSTCHRCSLL
jgi:hypothetical protein